MTILNSSSRRGGSATVAASITVALLIAAGARAEDTRSAAEIEAEVSRLQELLAKEQQALAEKSAVVAAAGVSATDAQLPTSDAGREAGPASETSIDALQADNDEPLEQVTVAAGRVRNGLASKQDTPASVSVIDTAKLQGLGADSLRDITRRAANISRANTSNARNQSLVIRGIGRRGTTEAQDPTVSVNVDGVPYAYAGLTAWDWVDLESAEVARGPQGTAGGHNPSFGLLTLNTKRPTFEPSTDYALRIGQRDSIFATAALGGPIIDDVLAWRGTAYVNKGLGPYSNQYWNGNQTYTDRLKISGKVQLLYQPTANYSAHLSADLQPKTFENDNGLNLFHRPPATYSDGSPVNLSTDASTRLARRWFGELENYSYEDNYLNYRSGVQNNDSQLPLITGMRGAALTQERNIGAESTIKSITAWRDLDFEARNDEGTPFDISTQGGGGVRYEQVSQELRLSSRIGRLADYTAGLFYIHHTYEVDSKTGWGDDAGAWFANAAQYNLLDSDGDGRYLLTRSLSQLRKLSTSSIDNTSYAAFGNVDWHVTEKASLVTGLRVSREDRKNKAFSLLEQDGYAPELNASISSFDVALGGFDSYYNSSATPVWVRDGFSLSSAAGTAGATLVAPGATALTTSSLAESRLTAANAAADAAALKYFRVASWSELTARQQQQLAYAQAIRKAQTAQIYDTIVAEPFKETQYTYVVSPRYEFTDDLTAYVSYQHGEKPGISQVVNGNSLLAGGETGNHYELGLKTTLFGSDLQLGADVFLSRLKNYQQSSSVVDEFTTSFNNDGQTYYTTVAANVPLIQVHGLEVDGAYSGIPYTEINLAAAYNIAKYKEFPNAAQPSENGYTGAAPYRDLSGEILPGAAKVTANLAVDFRYPVLNDYEFHSDVNVNYTSRYNSDITLSAYSWIEGYTIVDVGVGLGRQDRGFDVAFVVKNLINAEGKAYNWLNGTLDTTPRWAGVMLSGHL